MHIQGFHYCVMDEMAKAIFASRLTRAGRGRTPACGLDVFSRAKYQSAHRLFHSAGSPCLGGSSTKKYPVQPVVPDSCTPWQVPWLSCVCSWWIILVLFLPAASATTSGDTATLDAITIVDCLLPGEVRTSGKVRYIGPRIPVRTTAKLCTIRGGEYVLEDRANLKTSLAVWRAAAKQGDVQAQYYLAEIHEKGLGAPPDYIEAVKWYRKAADKGHIPSKLALSYLQAEGKGMAADPVAALNLYREAMGIDEAVLRASEAQQRIDEVREALETKLTDSAARIAALNADITRLKREGASHQQALAEKQQQLAQLQIKRQQDETELAVQNRSESPRMRNLQRLPSVAGAAPLTKVGDAEFGRYYALLIAIQNYRDRPLVTPIGDAEALATLLEQRYGFITTLLRDPSLDELAGTLERFKNELKPEDNLLLYFAGHGTWEGDEASWVTLESYGYRTDSLARLLAQVKSRSVLVIADACFAGQFGGAGKVIIEPSGWHEGIAPSALNNAGRLVLTSGGDAPVLDEGGGNHSVFSAALLDALKKNQRILTAFGLKKMIENPVRIAARRLGVDQTPTLSRVRDSGSDAGGQFFFVPKPENDETEITQKKNPRQEAVALNN